VLKKIRVPLLLIQSPERVMRAPDGVPAEPQALAVGEPEAAG
jgi:hypothetical protein